MTVQDEPLVLINLFSMPAEMVDKFVADWERSTMASRDAKGFRGTRLHRSLDPDAEYPVVNIARWDSVEDWQAAIEKFFSEPREDHVGGGWSSLTPHPNLYTVVHVTEDPQAKA
ncbi:antibiotic biosynthesis monooxygenase family protein [Amycolatopsis pigmentata]|uniref:Antibiotic biosynthesis monooxygenase family protein n=1 Tax=Amycolatopsis pigmentata TaxID=450801 RepID=A0ABW5G0P6_9PSEU